MPYGFAAAAVGSVASGLIGASASEKASSQQAAAQQQALALQEQVYGNTQAGIAPYQGYGVNALQNLQQQLGIGPGGAGPVASNPILQMLGIGGPGPTGSINPAQFTGSPGYQYELEEGQNAVTNAATRGPGGGNALLALQKNGQGLANQNWNQYLSNSSGAWQQMLANLGGGVSTGLSATGLGAGIGTSFANAAGGNLAGIGNAQSAGTIGSANAISGGINSLLNAGGSAGLSGGGGLANLINSAIYGQGGGGVFSSAPGSVPGGGTGMVPGGQGGGAMWGDAA